MYYHKKENSHITTIFDLTVKKVTNFKRNFILFVMNETFSKVH